WRHLDHPAGARLRPASRSRSSDRLGVKIPRAISGERVWVLAVALALLVIALAHRQGQDPDSRFYAGISARMAETPIAQWIAPEWFGNPNYSGLFREHPAGLFWPAALLARGGCPAEGAA